MDFCLSTHVFITTFTVRGICKLFDHIDQCLFMFLYCKIIVKPQVQMKKMKLFEGGISVHTLSIFFAFSISWISGWLAPNNFSTCQFHKVPKETSTPTIIVEKLKDCLFWLDFKYRCSYPRKPHLTFGSNFWGYEQLSVGNQIPQELTLVGVVVLIQYYSDGITYPFVFHHLFKQANGAKVYVLNLLMSHNA